MNKIFLLLLLVACGVQAQIGGSPTGFNYGAKYPNATNEGDTISAATKVPIFNNSNTLNYYANLGDLAALVGSSVLSKSQVSNFIFKVTKDQDDVDVLVVGDSTGDGTTEWVYLFSEYLGEKYPTHTINYELWDNGTSGYINTVISVGSGVNSINIWNASRAGGNAQYFTGERYNPAFLDEGFNPSLIFWNFGENITGDISNSLGNRDINIISQMTELSEPLLENFTNAGVLALTQFPRRDDDTFDQTVYGLRDFISVKKFGMIDTYQLFIDAGKPSSWYADNVHPSELGSENVVDIITPLFEGYQAEPISNTSSLITTSNNYIKNGYLSAIESSNLFNFDLVNADISRSTTHFETKYFSLLIEPETPGSQSKISQSIDKLDDLRGNVVTLGVRMYIEGGEPETTGLISIEDDLGEEMYRVSTESRGGWFWRFISKKIDENATFINVNIYGDQSTTDGVVYIDRCFLVSGVLPHDNVIQSRYARTDNTNIFTEQHQFKHKELIFSASIDWDLNTHQKAYIRATGDATVENPSNMIGGGEYQLEIVQDATGGRNITFGTSYTVYPDNDFSYYINPDPDSQSFLRFVSDGTSLRLVSSSYNDRTLIKDLDQTTSRNITMRDGFFTRDGVAVVEVLGVDATGGIVGTETNHDLLLRRSNAEKIRLTTTGATVTGTLSVTSGGEFTGTVSGDDPVNSDDFVTKGYGESNFATVTSGTFTPTLIDQGGGATYTQTVSARYERIGDLVHFFIYLQSVNTTGTPTGILCIDFDDMPFNMDSPEIYSFTVQRAVNLGTTFYYVGASFQSLATVGEAIAFPYKSALNDDFNVNMTSTTLSSGQLIVSGWYRTNE